MLNQIHMYYFVHTYSKTLNCYDQPSKWVSAVHQFKFSGGQLKFQVAKEEN